MREAVSIWHSFFFCKKFIIDKVFKFGQNADKVFTKQIKLTLTSIPTEVSAIQ